MLRQPVLNLFKRQFLYIFVAMHPYCWLFTSLKALDSRMIKNTLSYKLLKIKSIDAMIYVVGPKIAFSGTHDQ